MGWGHLEEISDALQKSGARKFRPKKKVKKGNYGKFRPEKRTGKFGVFVNFASKKKNNRQQLKQ